MVWNLWFGGQSSIASSIVQFGLALDGVLHSFDVCRHDDLMGIGLYGERPRLVYLAHQGEPDVIAIRILRQALHCGHEVDPLRIAYAVFTLDRELLWAYPLSIDTGPIVAVSNERGGRGSGGVIGTTGGQNEGETTDEKKNVSVQHSSDVSHSVDALPRNTANKLRENTTRSRAL